jgi:hypothetical protein
MKVSVSLSSQALKLIDNLPNKPARSEVIEEALALYFKNRKMKERDRSDIDILNSRNSDLNREALQVLDFQSFGRKCDPHTVSNEVQVALRKTKARHSPN